MTFTPPNTVTSLLGATGSTELRRRLAAWDHGGVRERRALLADFVTRTSGLTAPALEKALCGGASLLLARLTAWLRLTYAKSTCLALQLEAIHVFVASSSGLRFLIEFLEVGGALTVLEILIARPPAPAVSSLSTHTSVQAVRRNGSRQRQASALSRKRASAAHEEALIKSIALLHSVAAAGRKYKELLCEADAPRYVGKCMENAPDGKGGESILVAGRELMTELGSGNPAHATSVLRRLLAVMASSSGNRSQQVIASAQQAAAQSLRLLLPQWLGQDACEATPIVSPVLRLLASLELRVQYEAGEVLRILAEADSHAEEMVLSGLVEIMASSSSPTLPDSNAANIDGSSGNTIEDSAIAAAWHESNEEAAMSTAQILAQQGSAARTAASLCQDMPGRARRLIALNALDALLHLVANNASPVGQQQAAAALVALAYLVPRVRDAIA
eukprot:UC1_evm1s1912